MHVLLRLYHKILNLLLSILVKSKPIPTEPTIELGLDVSRPIIYILLYSSKIDLLTLRSQCLEHNLPDPFDPIVINNVKLPRYVFIHNDPYMFSYYRIKEELVKLFHEYLDLHGSNPDVDIQIVPISVIFGRHPRSEKNEVNPSLRIFHIARKLFSITWLGRDSFVCFLPSVSFRWIVAKYSSDKTIVTKLVRIARIYFSRQHLALVGPRQLTRGNLFKKLLTSKAIIDAIEDEAHNKKISYEKARKNAIMLMEEIAANFSYEMIRITDRILRFIWNRLYQGINIHNIRRVHQLAYSGHEIVYLPCHRSHMDYLLLSYVLYHQGLVPPHIAAGINLNFWPAGPIFRRLGAFFIRRTFKGNKLYSIVFREYLGELFNRNYSVEYFLEGRRSRTGRLLDPKTGTLTITIQAILRGIVTRPITLIPIYIGYEHVIEVSTYVKELHGAIKKKESLPQLIKCIGRLRKLGYSYVNFGEPLPLISWLNKHVPNWRESINPIKSIRPPWLTPTVNNIAGDLMVRINNAGATNAINLCCTALLASNHRSLTRKQLTEQLDCYLGLMRNVPYSSDLTVPSLSTRDLIDHAIKMNKFKIKKNDISDKIFLSREQARTMTYYRNNISHMLILPSLIATIISRRNHISRQKLLCYVNVLYPMLKAELFLRWHRTAIAVELDKLTNEFLRQELVMSNNNELRINPSRSRTLQLLAAGSSEMIQRYAIIFWLLSSSPSINRNKLEKKSQILARRLSISHDVNMWELFDKAMFNTLILTLREEGYINDNDNVETEEIIKVYQILTGLIASDIRLIIESNNE